MTLNSMRVWFGHYAKYVMGFMFFAMVITTFSWNWQGRGNANNRNGAAQSSTDVIAKVDGEDLDRAEFDSELNKIKQQFGQGGSLGIMAMGFLRTYALQQVELDKEVLATAEKHGISASSSDIDDMRAKNVKMADLRKKLSLPESASMGEVDSAMIQQGGQPLEVAMPDAMMREMVLGEKLQEQLKKGVVVSEQDARNSFNEYHVAHILIANKSSDVQASLNAKQILDQHVNQPGADFAKVAAQYSDDTNKAKGGDDGNIDVRTPGFPDEFKTAAMHLSPGQITPAPVKTDRGYYIIKLISIDPSKLPKDFEQNKAKYIADLTKQLQQNAMSKFVESVRSAPHDVKILDPGLRADKELADASQGMPATDPKRAAGIKAAIADYQKAIAQSNSSQDKAVMYLQIAHADDSLNDVPGEIGAYESAVKSYGDDSDLMMKLGDLYKQQHQTDKAVDAYQRASKRSWSSIPTHQTLAKDFDSLGRKDLAAAEQVWIAKYQAVHPQPKTAAGGPAFGMSPAGGGASMKPIVVKGSSNGKGGITLSPSSAPGPGGAVSVKPASSPTPMTTVKPAQ